MTEQEAISRMVAPRDRRPHIWRQGVLQIWVTRACDKACFGCTQGSNLSFQGQRPVMITPEQFDTACQSLQGYFGVVGLFGGNPVLHPQFDELCAIMRKRIPRAQRGIWCNHPHGKGAVMRATFNPAVSNLNVHLDQKAYDEFKRDWPESKVKGLTDDSRHSPPFVAMKDMDELQMPDGRIVPNSESARWELISRCDINRNWSSLIGVFRGELRAWFCEIAGAQAMLHQYNPLYPDTGVEVTPGWWNRGMEAFAHQVRHHCHDCGIPLRGYGELAVQGKVEQVSITHQVIYQPKDKNREVQVVSRREEIKDQALPRATDYIENSALR